MIRLIGDGGHAKVLKDLLARLEVPEGRFEEYFLMAIGDNKARRKVASENNHCRWFTAIHPTAFIARGVEIGDGSVVMAGAIVQPGCKIGKHCIVNSNAVVDHDCVLEDFVHIAPGAHLCGNVHVGEGTLVGVGVGIAPMAKIPSWSIVKAARLDICPQTRRD